MCGSPETNEEKVKLFLESVVRYDPFGERQVQLTGSSVLKIGGVFLLITYGDPDHRVPSLFPFNNRWSIDAKRLGAYSAVIRPFVYQILLLSFLCAIDHDPLCSRTLSLT